VSRTTAMLTAFVVIGTASAIYLGTRGDAEWGPFKPISYIETQNYFGAFEKRPAVVSRAAVVSQGWWSMYLQPDWEAKVALGRHHWKTVAVPASPPLASMAAR